jgi:hypothetical protein
MVCLTQSVTGRSPRRSGFDLRSIRVVFVVDQVTLWQSIPFQYLSTNTACSFIQSQLLTALPYNDLHARHAPREAISYPSFLWFAKYFNPFCTSPTPPPCNQSPLSLSGDLTVLCSGCNFIKLVLLYVSLQLIWLAPPAILVRVEHTLLGIHCFNYFLFQCRWWSFFTEPEGSLPNVQCEHSGWNKP